MQVLIYKRTHVGDPNAAGCFGANDCMRTVRSRPFEAVIGVGGIGPEARSHGIDGKVNWIGIGARKRSLPHLKGPLVTFDHFLDFGTDGPDFRDVAPVLSERMYSRNIRWLLHCLTEAERLEVTKILELAESAPASRGRLIGSMPNCRRKTVGGCPPRKRCRADR